jgi:hypothetical protein
LVLWGKAMNALAGLWVLSSLIMPVGNDPDNVDVWKIRSKEQQQEIEQKRLMEENQKFLKHLEKRQKEREEFQKKWEESRRDRQRRLEQLEKELQRRKPNDLDRPLFIPQSPNDARAPISYGRVRRACLTEMSAQSLLS